MIKRTSRNFKVPLVYGGQWKDHQTFQKWDPISKRLVQVNCCACPKPGPVNTVTATIISSHGISVGWTYSGSETQFEVKVYESATLPVNTSGTPVYTTEGALSNPHAATFSLTKDNYYVASVRVKSVCGYSTYVYSDSQQFICPDPDPVSNITLYSLDGITGQVSWGNYDGTNFEISIYQGFSLPVIPIPDNLVFIEEGTFESPYLATFVQNSGYYYVASMRAISDCGYSAYAYSEPAQSGVPPVDSVSLLDLITGSATVSWVYFGSDSIFEVKLYESISLPVDVNIPPVVTYEGTFTSPYTLLYSFTDLYYYVASVRVKTSGGSYSTYTYSPTQQYTAASFKEYVIANTAYNVDPGTGKMSINFVDPSYILNFSKTDKNSVDRDAYFNTISAGQDIKITKNPSNYYQFTTPTIGTSNPNYWSFTTTNPSLTGTLDIGDTVAVTNIII